MFLFTREMNFILFAFIFSTSSSWLDFTVLRCAEVLRFLIQYLGITGSGLGYPIIYCWTWSTSLIFFLVFKFRCQFFTRKSVIPRWQMYRLGNSIDENVLRFFTWSTLKALAIYYVICLLMRTFRIHRY